MADVLITFEDGSTELRPDNAPFRHSLSDYDKDLFRDGLPTWPALQGYVHYLDNCGRSGNKVFVWCEMGERGEGKPLAGEWRLCRVETVKEQIERLIRERDALLERHEDLVAVVKAGEEAADGSEGDTLFSHGPVARVFARVILHALTKAPNFYTFRVMQEGNAAAILTVQRPTGKTPEERYHEVCEERDTAHRILDEFAKTMGRAVGLLNDQRPVLRRLEEHAIDALDAHEAGVAEETIDIVIEELRAVLAAAKGQAT